MVAIGCLFSIAANGQANALKLQSGRSIQFSNTQELVSQQLTNGAGKALMYVKFANAPNEMLLQPKKIELQDYIGNNTFLVYLNNASVNSLVESGAISWAAVLPQDKVSKMLSDKLTSTSNKTESVLITVRKNTSRTDIETALNTIGATLDKEQFMYRGNIWKVTLAEKDLSKLAALAVVRFVNPILQDVGLVDGAIGITNSNKARMSIGAGGYGLDGTGVMTGIGDNSDPRHYDFEARVISFSNTVMQTHGDHVTGTVGGNGIIDEKLKGFAPKVNLVENYFSNILYDADIYRQDFNMTLTNNSYKLSASNVCAYAGTYDAYSQFVDQQLRDIPDLLHIFAAANDGGMTCSGYPAYFHTVAGGYQTAKNALVVANQGKTLTTFVPSSSRGPVDDGRLKPEITAMGQGLNSTVGMSTYQALTGTSMACPNVTGVASLLTQRFKQLNSNANPNAALLKAILMNGADDMGNPGPDFRFGFGMMNTSNSLRIIDNASYFNGIINTSQVQTFNVNVPPGKSIAKIMLYWHDPAASPSAPTALINDLDLTVLTPSAVTISPWVLDHTAANVNNNATQGIDRRNNVEQVTVANPASGTYIINVSGFNVPVPNQEFWVVYDLIDEGIAIQYPFGGEKMEAGVLNYIHWEASPGVGTFNLEYSIDNGNTWIVMQNNIAATVRNYAWNTPSSIFSNECLVRVTRGAEQSTSGRFIIMSRPTVQLHPTQCPGSIRMTWNGITGSNGYNVYIKQGDDMVFKGSTTNTEYTIYGLSPDTLYWVAVAPTLNGEAGLRSVAISRQPNSGNCLGLTNNGDLMVQSIVSPTHGREFTSTQLTYNEDLTIVLRNFDNVAATNYTVAYRVNNGPWTNNIYNNSIPAVGSLTLNVGTIDLSAVDTYTITVAVTNLNYNDPVKTNDTLYATIKHIANPPISLDIDYEEGFETAVVNHVGSGFFGLTGADRWDFTQTTAYGRVRSFVNNTVTISGTNALSMDNDRNLTASAPDASMNEVIGTFNLSNYDTTREIRFELDYITHAESFFGNNGNRIYVRGSDTDPWIQISAYNIPSGVVYNTGSISLRDLFRSNGQNFSTSTQFRLGQYDRSIISNKTSGTGMTFDNFKIYAIKGDVYMVSVDSVTHYNCGLDNNMPLNVRVANGVDDTVYNVEISYQLNNGPVVTEIIPYIEGKDTINYQFTSLLDMSSYQVHNLSVWVFTPIDTYRNNDSLLDIQIRNIPLIASYPYLEDFEDNNGYYYAEGANSSWAYGTPNSDKIKYAASGTKAWKTNLNGKYNANETSYLYLPCFDIAGLGKPMLSFSLATDIEEPKDGQLFDAAYIEYSFDEGGNWHKLGASLNGTNWYNDATHKAWAKRNEHYWHVASYELPYLAGRNVSLRFVFNSDNGTEFDGIAIDDIHIFDLQNLIFDKDSFDAPVTMNVGPWQNVNNFTDTSFNIAVSLFGVTGTLGKTEVQAYKHKNFLTPDSAQYILPKSFTIKADNDAGDTATVRFFVTDQAIKTIRNDKSCPTCTQPTEVYRLGMTQYRDNIDKSRENNLLTDNREGVYTYTQFNNIRWVPYDNGYYAEARVKEFTEFWFNDGGPLGIMPAGFTHITFEAEHHGFSEALLTWVSYIDNFVSKYELQRSYNGADYETIATFNAIGNDTVKSQTYTYKDAPRIDGGQVYYRVIYQLKDAVRHSTVIRMLDWVNVEEGFGVYPNPITDGKLYFKWVKDNDAPIQWALYALSGQKVINNVITENTYAGAQVIDLGAMGIQSGVYILKVKSGGKEWEFKLTVVRN